MEQTENKQALAMAHQWTHDGREVMLVKCVGKDGTSYNGFRWPLEIGATVEAPDWDAKAECGHGLHGWPWGLHIGDGKDPDWSSTWIIFGALPAEVIDLGGKCKAKQCVIRHVGTWQSATAFVLAGQMALVASASTGTSATGDRSASLATGDRSASSATGYRSASSATGDRSASSATGESSASSATGDSSASSATGDSSPAVVTGIYGKAQAGKFGCIALAWWNVKDQRSEMRCAEIGIGDGSDGKLKAGTWYTLDAFGAFVAEAFTGQNEL